MATEQRSILKVQLKEPWFTLVQLKHKTKDVRPDSKEYTELQPGQMLHFINDEFGFRRRLRMTVVSAKRYSGVRALLRVERLKHVVPSVDTVSHGAAAIGIAGPVVAIQLTSGPLVCGGRR
jgi:ASC-1-like (ASCH) protein